MSDPPPKPTRRWFQFRLRTLLILTAAIAIVMTWWSLRVRPQREAVEALRKIGGQIEYDARLPFTGRMKAPPKWPRGLLDAVGVDCFASVIWIDLNNTQVTDADLERLKNLTARQGIELNNTKLTDAGLQHLKDLTGLQYLYLNNTSVTDAGLESLKGLTTLQRLSLTVHLSNG